MLSMKGVKVLVTGGMGFIGNHLVKTLLDQGANVTLLDKSIYKPVYHKVDSANIIEGDMLSRGLLADILADIDICFHLAAISSIASCNKDWIFSHENNVLAFNGLLEEIKKSPKKIKLVYTSSSAVYGNPDQLPLSESMRAKPISAYGADKRSNEIYAGVFKYTHDYSSIGLRLFNVYGPGQLSNNPYSGVLSQFKRNLNTKTPMTIYGDGKHSRDFIFIADVIQAFIKAAKTSHEKHGIYNICTGRSVTIFDLAKIMQELSGKTVPIEFQPERVGDIKNSYGDNICAKEELGFQATTKLEDGIAEYLKAQEIQ